MFRAGFLFWAFSLTAAAQNFDFSAGVSYPAQNSPLATVTADFNGDGKLDLAVANAGSSSVSIFLGKGDGTFTAAAPAAMPGGCAPAGLGAADFTGHGKIDLLAICSFQSTVVVLPGQGNGQFGAPISTTLDGVIWDGFLGISLTNLVVADFNGDGKTDFGVVLAPPDASSDNGFSFEVFLGSGNGLFSGGSTVYTGSVETPSAAVTADFNGDGIPDLAIAASDLVSGEQGSDLLIFRGLGNGAFQQVHDYGVSGLMLAGALTTADINGDGIPDLIVASATSVANKTVTSSTITAFLGNGDLSFRQGAAEAESSEIGELVCADLRGTGKMDLIEQPVSFVAQKGSDATPLSSVTMEMRVGNGDGSFQSPTPVAMPPNLSPLWLQMAVGDWNGDGLPDLAFAASPTSASFGEAFTGIIVTDFTGLVSAYEAMPQGNLTILLNALTPPPAIHLSAAQLQFTGAAGGANPASQSVTLANSGGGTLAWTATSSAAWLTVTPASGTGAATLTIAAAVGSLASGPYTGTVRIAAAGAINTPQTISVTFTVTAPSTLPQITGVVNGASFQPGIESGSWVTILGKNLSNTNPGRTWLTSEIVNGNLPTALDGTSVTIDGKPAYVYYISPTQINVQAPTDSTIGSVNVVVTNNSQVSAAVPAQMQAYGPAFFLYGGTSYAVISNYPDYAAVGNPAVIPGTIAASPGGVLILWGTGFGPTNPSTPAGVEANGSAAATVPAITIGGTPVSVIAAVLTPGTAGLYQIAIQLPASLPAGLVALQASVGGVSSPAGILVDIAQ